jgi:gamma-glutamyltranspeptidase/glutathione hydrolase
VRAGDRPAGASFASRSAALGRSGAAGTAHPLATLTAIETLKRGGCAADAAIAAAACLGFLEPTGSGLGGDCYVLVWDPARAKLTGLAGSGRSPRSLSLETVRARAAGGVIPAYGAISVSTPGALDAWWTLHRRTGSRMAVALRCRHSFLRGGVPVPQIIGYHFGRDLETFRSARLGRGGMRQRHAHLCAGRTRAARRGHLS